MHTSLALDATKHYPQAAR